MISGSNMPPLECLKHRAILTSRSITPSAPLATPFVICGFVDICPGFCLSDMSIGDRRIARVDSAVSQLEGGSYFSIFGIELKLAGYFAPPTGLGAPVFCDGGRAFQWYFAVRGKSYVDIDGTVFSFARLQRYIYMGLCVVLMARRCSMLHTSTAQKICAILMAGSKTSLSALGTPDGVYANMLQVFKGDRGSIASRLIVSLTH